MITRNNYFLKSNIKMMSCKVITAKDCFHILSTFSFFVGDNNLSRIMPNSEWHLTEEKCETHTFINSTVLIKIQI